MLKKVLSLVLVAALSATVAVGGTMAYYTDKDTNTNSFNLSPDVDITLDEAPVTKTNDNKYVANNSAERVKENSYEGIYPGAVMPKDPTVHLSADSSAAYIRAKVTLTGGMNWMTGVYGGLGEEAFLKLINNTLGEGWEIIDSEINPMPDLVFTINYNKALNPGESTTPIFTEFVMPAEVTGELMNTFFGSDPSIHTYNINVVAEAIQVDGFSSPIAAFAASAGDGILVANEQELKDAMLIEGANIILEDDIVVDADTPLQWGSYMFVANGREVTINLNGKTITVQEDASLKTNAVFTTANGGTLNIVGDGKVVVENGKSGIFHAMNKNDQINVYGGTYISNSDNGSDALAIIYTNSGNVDVYGGTFCSEDNIECANAEDAQGDRLSIVFHEGAVLKHNKYYDGSDATRIQLEEGCTLVEVEIDGTTWYQVTKANA